MNNADILKTALVQILEQGKLEFIESGFSANYVAHSGSKTHKGHNFIRRFIQQLRKAIPDLKILRFEILSQSDNLISCQKTFSGTHKAALKGIPASGKKVKWHEISVTRFENNLIVEEWVLSDLAFQLILNQKTPD